MLSPTPPPANTITITNKSGTAQTNYPLQFGRPFVRGEIPAYPQVKIDGLAARTQADVKNRHPDGSVKYAIIAVMIPSLPASGSVTLSFQNQTSDLGGATGTRAAPLTTAQMLDPSYNFDAQIQLTRPATITGLAETSLAAWQAITDGSLTVTVDGVAYTLPHLNFATIVGIPGAGQRIRDAAKIAGFPFTVYLNASGDSLLYGGNAISLGTALAGVDIAGMLFKSGAATAPAFAPIAASARAMIQAGACTLWTSGTIAQTILCADDSIDRIYDMGSGTRSFRPRFYVTFWPATKQVTVRYVGEVTNSKALEAIYYDLALTAGGATVYTQRNIPHSVGTRWTRTAWIGGAPEARININHNIGYLAATLAFPNYDGTVTVPENVTSSYYNSFWLPTDKSIGGRGQWQKYMPTTGGRDDIGPLPNWAAKWLYTGDYRDREITLGQADLAASWPNQVREGDPGKWADRPHGAVPAQVPALGKPISAFSHPTLWLFDARGPGTAADAIKVINKPYNSSSADPFAWSDWSPDGAHIPDPFYTPYMLTGDYYYLEQLQFWVGAYSAKNPPDWRGGTKSFIGAGIIDQIRGEGWQLRDRVNAAVASPDSDPQKAIFTDMVNSALAFWEGKRNITGSPLQSMPEWAFGYASCVSPSGIWAGNGVPPLHWWGGNYTVVNVSWLAGKAGGLTDNWMQSYVMLELGRAVEQGFPAQALFAWLGTNVIEQLTTPGYNPFLISAYESPFVKLDHKTYFQTWLEMVVDGFVWTDPYLVPFGTSPTHPWGTGGLNTQGYMAMINSAVSLAATLPGGDAAWAQWQKMIHDSGGLAFGSYPMWALTVRL